MIGHKRIPSREGGVEIVVDELSTRLVKLGYRVDAYNRSNPNPAPYTHRHTIPRTYSSLGRPSLKITIGVFSSKLGYRVDAYNRSGYHVSGKEYDERRGKIYRK